MFFNCGELITRMVYTWATNLTKETILSAAFVGLGLWLAGDFLGFQPTTIIIVFLLIIIFQVAEQAQTIRDRLDELEEQEEENESFNQY